LPRRNCDHRAGNAAGLDVGLQRLADPRQPLAGEADLFRLCARQRIVGERGNAGNKRDVAKAQLAGIITALALNIPVGGTWRSLHW
jgi:hypothetical protein